MGQQEVAGGKKGVGFWSHEGVPLIVVVVPPGREPGGCQRV